jgi:hypothetical protein
MALSEQIGSRGNNEKKRMEKAPFKGLSDWKESCLSLDTQHRLRRTNTQTTFL